MMNTTDSKSFDAIVESLRNNILEVTFTKVDGEQRIMPCTLRPEMLPVREQGEAAASSPNRSVIRAFAIDKQAWRSFRVDSVLSIGVLDE